MRGPSGEPHGVGFWALWVSPGGASVVDHLGSVECTDEHRAEITDRGELVAA